MIRKGADRPVFPESLTLLRAIKNTCMGPQDVMVCDIKHTVKYQWTNSPNSRLYMNSCLFQTQIRSRYTCRLHQHYLIRSSHVNSPSQLQPPALIALHITWLSRKESVMIHIIGHQTQYNWVNIWLSQVSYNNHSKVSSTIQQKHPDKSYTTLPRLLLLKQSSPEGLNLIRF